MSQCTICQNEATKQGGTLHGQYRDQDLCDRHWSEIANANIHSVGAIADPQLRVVVAEVILPGNPFLIRGLAAAG